MPGLDLGAGYGAGGVADALQQILAQRHQAQQLMLQQKQLEDQAAWRQMQAEENARAHKADEATRAENARTHQEDSFWRMLTVAPPPMGGELSQEAAAPIQKYDPGLLRTTPNNVPAPPPMLASGSQTGDEAVPGTIANSPMPSRQTQTFLGTRQQHQEADTMAAKEAALARQREADAQKMDNANWRVGIQQDLANFKQSQGRPEHFTPVPQYDESGKPIGTLAFNTGTGGVAPVRLPGGGTLVTKPPPGAAQAAVKESNKKEALDTLTQLDQSIDAAKEFIGPGAGQVTSLEQLAGLADPKAQALGVKMLYAKMKIDAGIGGMRAAASPQILARWDNFLGNKVTPESLHAATQALRELLGGAAAPAAPAAKRFNPATGKVE